MTVEERVKLATSKITTIADLLQTLIQIRANNELIWYSGVLSKQVGKSYAANAFNVLTGCLFETEILRLCALWDSAGNEGRARGRNSIPAVGWLIEPDEVLEAFRARSVESALKIPSVGPPPDAALKELITQRKIENAKGDAGKLLERLKNARIAVKAIANSEQLSNLRNFRDKYVAHSLVETELDKKGEISLPNYGEEKELLDKTIDVVARSLLRNMRR